MAHIPPIRRVFSDWKANAGAVAAQVAMTAAAAIVETIFIVTSPMSCSQSVLQGTPVAQARELLPIFFAALRFSEPQRLL
jgi:mannose/fructose/N-acetylgalactosamine-specific phosphotransferase system component IIC